MYTETFFFSKQEVHIGIERRHTDHWLLFCKDSQLLKDKMGKPGREMKMCKNSRIMPVRTFCWQWAWEIFSAMKGKLSFYC